MLPYMGLLGAILLTQAGGLAAQEAVPRKARPSTTPETSPVREQWQAAGERGAVVAGGAEAVEAGLEILKAGGNAADAAAATLLALAVTDAHLYCFGGEVPILVHDAARGTVEVIAGQGGAPKLATREAFADHGGIPVEGLLPAAVPGAPDAILTLLDRAGTKRFGEIAAPTLKILDRAEFPWHQDFARTLGIMIAAEETSPDRRTGLRRASDAFYRGPIARDLDAWSRQAGGFLRYEDLARHTTRIEDPLLIPYRGLTIAKCGPWTQGPSLLQSLQILEGFDLADDGAESPDTIHRVIEALKLGLADRDVYYGDPLFVDVPLDELLDPAYASKRRGLIDPAVASLEQRPGDPVNGNALLPDPSGRFGVGPGGPSSDTTTCLVADAAGNVVAATPSGWSGVLAGDTGVWLGTRLQSATISEGHPNQIEPGKRPRITLTPTMVLDHGKPVMAVSVAGGDLQDQTTLQVLLNLIDFGMTPAQAVAGPRYSTEHHVGSFGMTPPKLGSLTLDERIDPAVAENLSARGHKVNRIRGPIAAPSALRMDPSTRRIEVAGDQRSGRHAAAW